MGFEFDSESQSSKPFQSHWECGIASSTNSESASGSQSSMRSQIVMDSLSHLAKSFAKGIVSTLMMATASAMMSS